jgi:hypothetical protein
LIKFVDEGFFEKCPSGVSSAKRQYLEAVYGAYVEKRIDKETAIRLGKFVVMPYAISDYPAVEQLFWDKLGMFEKPVSDGMRKFLTQMSEWVVVGVTAPVVASSVRQRVFGAMLGREECRTSECEGGFSCLHFSQPTLDQILDREEFQPNLRGVPREVLSLLSADPLEYVYQKTRGKNGRHNDSYLPYGHDQLLKEELHNRHPAYKHAKI